MKSALTGEINLDEQPLKDLNNNNREIQPRDQSFES